MTDWTTQAADVIENTVTVVRENTVGRAATIVRIVIYGLLAALLFIPVLVLLGVLVFRVLFLIGFFADHPWLPYGIVSAACLLGGMILMTMGRRPAKSM